MSVFSFPVWIWADFRPERERFSSWVNFPWNLDHELKYSYGKRVVAWRCTGNKFNWNFFGWYFKSRDHCRTWTHFCGSLFFFKYIVSVLLSCVSEIGKRTWCLFSDQTIIGTSITGKKEGKKSPKPGEKTRRTLKSTDHNKSIHAFYYFQGNWKIPRLPSCQIPSHHRHWVVRTVFLWKRPKLCGPSVSRSGKRVFRPRSKNFEMLPL